MPRRRWHSRGEFGCCQTKPKPQIPNPKGEGEGGRSCEEGSPRLPTPSAPWELGVGGWRLRSLERESESELHRARRVREVRARGRLSELRAALVERVPTVVLPVEQRSEE